MTRRLLALLSCLLLTALAACSGDEESPRELTAQTPVARDVPTNPDRDAATVEGNLTSVDPCRLFTAAAASEAGDRLATRRPNDAFSCRIGTFRTTVIQLGTEFDDLNRYYQGRHEAAGAVSYRSTTSQRDCAVSLPVSQELAIEVRSYDRACASTVGYAEAAARVLRERPASVERAEDDTNRFTACGLLAAAADSSESAVSPYGYSPSDCALTSEDTNGVRLVLDRDGPTVDEADARDVDGVRATLDRVEEQCWLQWDLPGSVAAVDGSVLTARLMTDTCDQARRLLPKVDAAARRTPPAGSPEGLLHDWNDGATDDLATTGACVDIVNAAALQCAPAREAAVPDDPMDLIEQGEADPDVLCAAVTPIVRKHLGNQLTPATTLAAAPRSQDEAVATECSFGEPTHAVHVSVQVSTSRPHLSEYGEYDEVAGHPAELIESAGVKGTVPMKRFWIAHQVGQPGGLMVQVSVTPPRAEGNWQGIEVDPSPVDAANELAADLTRTLLS